MKGYLKILQAVAASLFTTVTIGAVTNKPVQAFLITSPTSILSPTVIDFNQFSGGRYTDFVSYTNFPGPVQVSSLAGEDVLWFASPNSSASLGSGNTDLESDLGLNRGWDGDFEPDYVAQRFGYVRFSANNPVNTVSSITFTFNSGPKSAVGAFMNYQIDFPGRAPVLGPVLIEALGATGAVLESYDLVTQAPIRITLPNDAAFRGIQRAQNDIFAFRISAIRTVLVDDLTFTTIPSSPPAQSVPEPGALVGLVGALALGSTGLLKRKPVN